MPPRPSPSAFRRAMCRWRETPVTTYFTDKVLTDVSAALSEQYGLDSAETTNLLYNGGLRIYTTVDPDLQAVMENALERGYSSFFPTSGLGVATQATKYNEDGTIARDENGDPIREDVVETPQAAMVSVGYDGSLKAIVGGIGEKVGEPRAEPRHRAPPGGQHHEAHRRVCAGAGKKQDQLVHAASGRARAAAGG